MRKEEEMAGSGHASGLVYAMTRSKRGVVVRGIFSSCHYHHEKWSAKKDADNMQEEGGGQAGSGDTSYGGKFKYG
jgi:hypothetical protein